ncbi:MAG: homoserine dehydrogenase [Bacteroidales bacterium]
MKINVGIIGFGTVGQGLVQILLSKADYLQSNYNVEFVVTAVSDARMGMVYNPAGLDLQQLLSQAQAGTFSGNEFNGSNREIIENTNTQVWCELTWTNLTDGMPATDHVRWALGSGKHVATSNKGPAALYYRELSELARQNGVEFRIEGTVVAGTPVLNLAEGPLAGCTIDGVKGILNGTTNFILTMMEEGMDYESALSKAQQLGYAEADPTGDVEGFDARGKVCILSNVVMGVPLKPDEIPCKGIAGITSADIEKAKSEGKRWKLIGEAVKTADGKIKAGVAPEMVPLEHPLAGISGATNALTFSTDLLGEVTIVGPGAGKSETGFALLSDMIYLARKYFLS